MTLRAKLNDAVDRGDLAMVEKIVTRDRRALRHLVTLTYRPDPKARECAARGLALAAKSHPRHVQEIVRRLVWAMNDESGTNARSAPEVIIALAHEEPRLLLPLVPDLTRLATDEGLRGGLSTALRIIAEACPGEVGGRISSDLNQRIARGDCCADDT